MLCPRCFEKFAEKDTAFVCTDVRCPASAQSPRPLLQGTSSFFGGLKGPKCPQCNRQTSQKACPHCGMLLPHSFGEGKEVPIAIIGAKAAGKSNYIGVLIKMLRDQLGIAFNFSLVATGGDSTIRRYREDFYNPLFVKHVAVKASDATTEEIEPLMYSVLFQNERNKISRADKYQKDRTEERNDISYSFFHRIHELFSSEIGRNFAPFFGLPFQERDIGISMGFKPILGPFNHLKKFFSLWSTLQLSFAFLLLYPSQSIPAIRINSHTNTFLLHQSQSMDNGQKLTDIVGSINRTKVKDFLTGQ